MALNGHGKISIRLVVILFKGFFPILDILKRMCRIGHFTVVYIVAKPLIWSEAEGDLVVIETSI